MSRVVIVLNTANEAGERLSPVLLPVETAAPFLQSIELHVGGQKVADLGLVEGWPTKARPVADEDTATSILAGLVETVRVMRDNAWARALTGLFADYDAALVNLLAAAELLPPFYSDPFRSPLDRIADGD